MVQWADAGYIIFLVLNIALGILCNALQDACNSMNIVECQTKSLDGDDLLLSRGNVKLIFSQLCQLLQCN